MVYRYLLIVVCLWLLVDGLWSMVSHRKANFGVRKYFVQS